MPSYAQPPQTPPPKPASARAVELRLPADIVYQRASRPDSAVVFRHGTHVALAGDKCLGCHPLPFRMLRPERRVAHADMDRGASCGTCHDGKSAFGVKDPAACQTCHAGIPKPDLAVAGATAPGKAPARGLPAPIRFARGESSPGTVRFRHETHGADRCASCHPKLFAMKSTGGRPGGAMHEAGSCGACHDGRRAFGVENADACARCHKEGGS
jgi:c(7)-type cytochrome triheme protein